MPARDPADDLPISVAHVGPKSNCTISPAIRKRGTVTVVRIRQEIVKTLVHARSRSCGRFADIGGPRWAKKQLHYLAGNQEEGDCDSSQNQAGDREDLGACPLEILRTICRYRWPTLGQKAIALSRRQSGRGGL